MDNTRIYERTRQCPPNALREIQAGKLRGKSDINPMWRIKTLTELFGPCGEGWRTSGEQFWTTPGANGEIVAWCSLQLTWREDRQGTWSEPVFGVGGAMLVDTQKGKLTTNDDAYKMAYTDAISVACKALGLAADVYWQADVTKYSPRPDQDPPRQTQPKVLCECCGNPILPVNIGGKRYSVDDIVAGSLNKYGGRLCWSCMKNAKREAGGANAQPG